MLPPCVLVPLGRPSASRSREFRQALLVEIQVRTQLQHEWAELFEKLADVLGRGIRYGEPPDHSLPLAEREALSGEDKEEYDARYDTRIALVEFAQMVAVMIHAYELGEQLDPTLPVVREFRGRVDAALTDLDVFLEALHSERSAD